MHIKEFFNLKKMGQSLKVALVGIKIAFLEEQSFRIQAAIGFLVFVLMFCFPLNALERTILVIAIGFVLALEILNSQIERILDFLEPNFNHKIKRIKDLAAGAVLVASLTALLTGVFIFWRYLS